jgi:hypothetical protein
MKPTNSDVVKEHAYLLVNITKLTCITLRNSLCDKNDKVAT